MSLVAINAIVVVCFPADNNYWS